MDATVCFVVVVIIISTVFFLPTELFRIAGSQSEISKIHEYYPLMHSCSMSTVEHKCAHNVSPSPLSRDVLDLYGVMIRRE